MESIPVSIIAPIGVYLGVALMWAVINGASALSIYDWYKESELRKRRMYAWFAILCLLWPLILLWLLLRRVYYIFSIAFTGEDRRR